MSIRLDSSDLRLKVFTGGLAAVLSLSVAAFDSAPAETVRVIVLPDRYTVGERQFSDVVALEAWMKPAGARVLQLDACGAASAKQLLTAVERFHAVYVEGIEIRTLSEVESECVIEAAPTGRPSNSIGRRLIPDEHLATDQYGRSTIP